MPIHDALNNLREAAQSEDYAVFNLSLGLFQEKFSKSQKDVYLDILPSVDYFSSVPPGKEREHVTLLLNDEKYDEFIFAYHAFCHQFTGQVEALKEDVASVYYFFEDAPHNDLTALLFSIHDEFSRESELLRLKALSDSEMLGLELTNKNQTQFVIFLPDASEKGRKRYSGFAENGFFTHYTQDDYASVLDDAWEQGFRYPTSGNLERLSIRDEWTSGTEEVLLIQQHNLGKISFDDTLEAMRKIRR